MSSTNKTPNLNLPQWVATDKPERTDFNQAMSDIDTNIKSLSNTMVKLTGNQSVSGIKTFASSPIVPTPTTNTQAANKTYVDSKVMAFNYIVTLPAGTVNVAQTMVFDFTGKGLPSKPAIAILDITSAGGGFVTNYLFDPSTATSLSFRVSNHIGSWSSIPYRVGIVCYF